MTAKITATAEVFTSDDALASIDSALITELDACTANLARIPDFPSNVRCQEDARLRMLRKILAMVHYQVNTSGGDHVRALGQIVARCEQMAQTTARNYVLSLTPLDMSGTLDYSKIYAALGTSTAAADCARIVRLAYTFTNAA